MEKLFDDEKDDECGFTNAFLRRLEKTQTSILSRRAALRNSRTIKKKGTAIPSCANKAALGSLFGKVVDFIF